MAALRQDLAYTFRRISKSPALVFTIMISIGLGIAANSTIFSMVSRFVLRPAPVGDPGTLMTLHTTHDGDQCCNNFPWPTYTDVRDKAKSFSGVAAYDELLPASIGGSGERERVWGQSVPPPGKPFPVVGVAPAGYHGLELILDPQFWIPLGIVEQFAPGLPSRDS